MPSGAGLDKFEFLLKTIYLYTHQSNNNNGKMALAIQLVACTFNWEATEAQTKQSSPMKAITGLHNTIGDNLKQPTFLSPLEKV